MRRNLNHVKKQYFSFLSFSLISLIRFYPCQLSDGRVPSPLFNPDHLKLVYIEINGIKIIVLPVNLSFRNCTK